MSDINVETGKRETRLTEKGEEWQIKQCENNMALYRNKWSRCAEETNGMVIDVQDQLCCDDRE